MTVIVGLCDKGKVYIGGDSATTASHDITSLNQKKVFRNGDFLIGVTGSVRMLQLLRYSLVPPKHNPTHDILTYLVNEFVKEVRACLKNGGCLETRDGIETGGKFLLGHGGRLFYMGSDFQVSETMCGYRAIGSAEDLALGSLYTSEGLAPEGRVLKALGAAQKFNVTVREPFYVEVL